MNSFDKTDCLQVLITVGLLSIPWLWRTSWKFQPLNSVPESKVTDIGHRYQNIHSLLKSCTMLLLCLFVISWNSIQPDPTSIILLYVEWCRFSIKFTCMSWKSYSAMLSFDRILPYSYGAVILVLGHICTMWQMSVFLLFYCPSGNVIILFFVHAIFQGDWVDDDTNL